MKLMKTSRIRMLLAVSFTLAVMACATGDMPSGRMTQSETRSMVSTWPETAQMAATMAMEKYGMPDEATASILVWHHQSGPWKRSVITRQEVQHDFPMPHKDVWEQVINYRVPTEKFDDLAEYDGSVIVERTKGELSARCDKEEANFLAINLADDIINGRRTVSDARQFYADQIQAMMQGRKGPYVQGLRFAPPTMAMTAYSDMPASMTSSSPR